MQKAGLAKQAAAEVKALRAEGVQAETNVAGASSSAGQPEPVGQPAALGPSAAAVETAPAVARASGAQSRESSVDSGGEGFLKRWAAIEREEQGEAVIQDAEAGAAEEAPPDWGDKQPTDSDSMTEDQRAQLTRGLRFRLAREAADKGAGRTVRTAEGVIEGTGGKKLSKAFLSKAFVKTAREAADQSDTADLDETQLRLGIVQYLTSKGYNCSDACLIGPVRHLINIPVATVAVERSRMGAGGEGAGSECGYAGEH